jgi:SpoVK/Ycf46/Vps4 family AAA+-type ATPase
MSQTRSSIVRLSLQLWDAETGELVWASLAETNMANEAVSQDPVYLEDIARVTLGSMMADFVNQKTASTYTPVNKFLNDLVEEAVPHEKPEQQKITEPDKKAE